MIGSNDIKKMLEYAHKPTVDMALEFVNLKDNERKVIDLVDIRGLTHEEASMELDCSVKTIYNIKRKAYKKIAKSWEKEKVIMDIIEGF